MLIQEDASVTGASDPIHPSITGFEPRPIQWRRVLSWIVSAAFATWFVVDVFVRPFPPAGPMGATRVATPASRAAVVEAIGGFIGQQFGGRTMLLYDTTWTGGVSETDTPLPSDSNYSEFRGIAFLVRWPFVATYDGYVSAYPGFAYRAQYQVDGFGFDMRSPAELSATERAQMAGQAVSLLLASGVGDRYAVDSLSGSVAVGSDPDGLLQAKMALPAAAATAPAGVVELDYAPAGLPIVGIVDTASE